MSEPVDELPTPEEAKSAVIRMLYRAVQQGGKARHVRYVCEHHPKFDSSKSPAGPLAQGANAGGNVYHEIDAFFVDSATINAAKELMDRMEGRPGQQKQKDPLPKFDGDRMEDLTDEQLAAIIAAGPGVSTPDG